MHTAESALESLKKYDIRESDLLEWERELRLDIPVDANGHKQYSPHHINLFKNIKKHIALGRTMGEIKRIINLPPIEESKIQPRPQTQAINPAPQAPQKQVRQHPGISRPTQPTKPGAASRPADIGASQTPAAKPAQATVIQKSPYASVPKRPAAGGSDVGTGAANVVNLVQRLTREKDQLYKKLMETEKLNSHLYSANNLYNRKVREMSQEIVNLRESLQEDKSLKLLDDKDKLHRELIAAEKKLQYRQDEIQNLQRENDKLRTEIRNLEARIGALTSAFNATRFCGDWMETGHLVEIAYDNFGINIETERVRLFRISEPPSRLYGATAMISTSYQYETNSLWKRNETLTVSYIDEDTLEGELIAEYILEGVPVAKALYRVTCRRSE